MIATGADLIRASAHISEQKEKMDSRDHLRAVDGKDLSKEDAESALLRFAKFVNKENKKRPKERKQDTKQVQKFHAKDPRKGEMIDIYA